jgi:hypothetical protein
MATGITKLAVLEVTNRAFSGVPILGSDLAGLRELQKSDEMFKKIKPTQSYGVVDYLKFRFVAFMRFVGKASETDLKDLDIYEKHQALQSSIDKVKKAYQEYIPAAKAAKDATVQIVNQARAQEYSKATLLVQSYKELIALADKQADELVKSSSEAGILKQAYLFDVNEAMTEAVKAQGTVLYTVNKLEAQLAVQFQDAVGREEVLAQRFTDFLVNFEKHVVEACDKFGIVVDKNHKRVVAQAFIEGLMGVPGLNKDHIPYYLSLISQGADDRNQQMIDHFFSEMQRIVQGDMPITEELVEGIQFDSIHLVDCVDNLKDNLEYARSLSKQFNDIVSEQEVLQDQIDIVLAKVKECSKHLDERVEYTVREFLEFIQDSAVYKQNDKSIESLSDAFADMKRLKAVKERITVLEQQSAENIARYTQEVDQKEQRLGLLNAALHEYENDTAAPCEEAITRKTRALSSLEQTLGEVKQVLGKLDEAGRELSLSPVQNTFDARKAAIVAEIDGLKAQRDAHRIELERQADDITRLKGEIALDRRAIELFKIDGSEDVKVELAQLRSERDRLTALTLKVSGTELIQMGAAFEIAQKEGKVHEALAKARDAQSKVEPLSKQMEELNASYAAHWKKAEQLKEDPFFTEGCAILDEKTQTLQLLPEFLLEGQHDALRSRMEEQLEFAVAIGGIVHEYLTMKNGSINGQTLQKIKVSKYFTAEQAEAFEQSLSAEQPLVIESEFPKFPGHYRIRRKPHVMTLIAAPLADKAELAPSSEGGLAVGLSSMDLEVAEIKAPSANSPGLLSRISTGIGNLLGRNRPAAPDYFGAGDLNPPRSLQDIFRPGREQPVKAYTTEQLEAWQALEEEEMRGSESAIAADLTPPTKIERTVQLTNSKGEAEYITLTQKAVGTFEGKFSNGDKVIGSQDPKGNMTYKLENGSVLAIVIEEEV